LLVISSIKFSELVARIRVWIIRLLGVLKFACFESS